MDTIGEIGNGVWRCAQVMRFISQVHFQPDNSDACLLLMDSVLEAQIEQGSLKTRINADQNNAISIFNAAKLNLLKRVIYQRKRGNNFEQVISLVANSCR